MFKERALLILVMFLLLQAPLAIFFSKKGSFDEMKGKIVISELALVSLFVLSVSLVRPTSQKQEVQKTRIRETTVGRGEDREEIETMTKQKALLEQESVQLRKELQLLEKRGSDQEKELTARIRELEELQTKFPSELFSFVLKELHVVSESLFAQLEEIQEVRRQHMIEMRALLKKEPVGSFEKKTVLASLPRGNQEPLVLMNLVMIFAEKLSATLEGKGDIKSFVRRKFFDELRALKTLSCIFLSLDTPSETIIPLPYLPEDVKKLADFIRPKMGEENSSFLLDNQGERWFIQKLSKPFFEDVFLCLKR